MRITAAAARRLLEQGAALWDVRTPAEYAAGHIPGAANHPLGALDGAPLPAGPVIVYCASGARSARAASWLGARGCVVYDLGPLSAWPGGTGR